MVKFLAAVALVTFAASARADEKTIVVHNQVIHGRVVRPLVVAEISHPPPSAALSQIHVTLPNHVEQAVHSSPF